tara:strand:+ start:392 stop:646 length:255 start_codon:yes stop_codon:yes gene_type:complete
MRYKTEYSQKEIDLLVKKHFKNKSTRGLSKEEIELQALEGRKPEIDKFYYVELVNQLLELDKNTLNWVWKMGKVKSKVSKILNK